MFSEQKQLHFSLALAIAFLFNARLMAMVETRLQPETILRSQIEPLIQESSEKWITTFGFQSEVRSINSDIAQRRPVQGLSGQEFSFVGAISRPQDGLTFSWEFGSERIETENDFLLTKALVSYRPLQSKFIELVAGQHILPYGLYSEQDRFLSTYPEPYNRIMTWSRGIDVGVGLSLHPLGDSGLSFNAHTYSGQTTRPSEGRRGNPEQAPRLLSVHFSDELYEARLTSFTHDLKFLDRIEARSLSFRLGRYFQNVRTSWFQPAAVFEVHEWDEIQTQGGRLRSRSFVGSALLRVRFATVGYLLTNTEAALLDPRQSSVATDRMSPLVASMAFVGIHPIPGLRLQVEQRKSQQGTLIFADETAVRLIADLSRRFDF